MSLHHEKNPLFKSETASLKPKITIDSILTDNNSKEAEEARFIWFCAREESKQTIVKKCSDAREINPIPDTSIEVNFIGAGKTPLEPKRALLESPGVFGEAVMTHFDGEIMPDGCGGLAAKDDQEKNDTPPVNDLGYYIKNNILHPDPVVQSVLSAMTISDYTEKPILATTQDHRTGKVYPVGVYYSWKNEGDVIASKVVLKSIRKEWYDPEEFYANGLPEMSQDRLIPHFIEFLNAADEKQKRLNERFFDLYEASKVQDPPMIALSTSSMPLGTWLPDLGRTPGLVFKIFGPREKSDNGRVCINPEELKDSSSQIDYPISQSLQNHGQEGKPFARTNTILLDTEDIYLSLSLAYKLLRENENVRNWANIEGHQIIVSENEDGIIKNIEVFNPQI